MQILMIIKTKNFLKINLLNTIKTQFNLQMIINNFMISICKTIEIK